MIQQTLVLLKPGALQRRIIGEVLSRFERKGFNIIALKLLRPGKPLVETHYAEHKGKDFYDKLVAYTLSGPLVAMILESEDAVPLARLMIGPANLMEQRPGSIRGDYAARTRLNIVHASDSPESAAREIKLFFTPEEICPWEDGNAQWF
ncbi:MAG: nucleoside-diphosphate kinase [Treponema sp.]|jgi:nucleoside-diphosphate kinase|nr:nucleoside-diphosphate kinase [Treponema sp.]